MKNAKQWLCLLLAACLLFTACAQKPQSEDAAEDKTQMPTAPQEELSAEDAARAAAEFSVALLRHAASENENRILSPYSVLVAMAMAANGADGATLAQMESVLQMRLDDLNALLASAQKNAGAELIGANGLWVRDGICLQPAYTQTCKQLFDAEVTAAPFDDKTLEEINQWVSEHTKHRILQMLPSLNEDAWMVLVNALSFDAKWEKPYEERALHEGTFTAADGSVQTVTMMSGKETRYLDDGKAIGFLKDYAGGRYSYLALLPRQGISMQEYLASLSGAGLLSAVAAASHEKVLAKMPAYSAETSVDLTQILQQMGMTDAFCAQADFGRLADVPMLLSQVVHKTQLKVYAGGTEAAAATAVIATKGAVAIDDYREVTLDRPYVMAIIDRETDLILFLGVVNSVNTD